MRRRTTILFSAVLMISGGCASPEASSGAGTLGAPESSHHPIMASTDSGLEIRILRVPDHGGLGPLLAGGTKPGLEDAAQRSRAARNGLRLRRVPERELDTLLATLGPASFDRTGWHGQAYHWREIAAHAMGPEPQAVGVDGRPHRLHGGTLRFMVRGWTVPMEDGPHVEVELLPVHDRSREGLLEPLRPRLGLGQQGDRFDGARMELLLDAGWAYVLVAEPPGADWDDPDAARNTVPGPAVDALPTVGELVLAGLPAPASIPIGPNLPGQRSILVFLPRIPAVLYPPDAADTTG